MRTVSRPQISQIRLKPNLRLNVRPKTNTPPGSLNKSSTPNKTQCSHQSKTETMKGLQRPIAQIVYSNQPNNKLNKQNQNLISYNIKLPNPSQTISTHPLCNAKHDQYLHTLYGSSSIQNKANHGHELNKEPNLRCKSKHILSKV